MKKTLLGLFVVLTIVLIPTASHAATTCTTESDYLKRQQELTALSPCVKPGQECVRKLTTVLTKELNTCRAQVDAQVTKACLKGQPKGTKAVAKSDGTCKLTCPKGSYLTVTGKCKIHASSKDQKRISTLMKQIEKLTKELERLQNGR